MFKKIKISEIPQGDFEGYCWPSNASVPNCQETGALPVGFLSNLPFIIEGHYFDKKQQISISIRNTGAEYDILFFDLKAIEDKLWDKQIYIGHSLGKRNVCVFEIWQPVADPMLENMEVLKPSAVIFTGFVNQ